MHSIKLHKEGLTGHEVNSNRQIKLISTDDPENVKAYQRYKDLFNKAEDMVKVSFNHHLKREINDGVVNFLYNEAWE